MAERVDILWTSGWDSTFRVSELLLRERRPVQPWYVANPSRRSTGRELATMGRIRSALVRKDASVAGLLAPLRVRRLRDIPPDEAVTASLRALAARSTLGTQYDWLARLAKAEQVTLELCIHRDDRAHGFLEDHVVVGADGVPRLDPRTTDPDLRVFRAFTFPVFDLSKIDMQERAEQQGFADVMEMTWFCHSPLLDGRPCGFCAPCQYTREEGLGRRVPEPTPLRRLHHTVVGRSWKAWLGGKRIARSAVSGLGARGAR